jgi:thiazole synthase
MLKIGNLELQSRLLLGTAQYPSPKILIDAIFASTTQMITVSLRRQNMSSQKNVFWEHLKTTNCHLLPNTAGCYSAKEAVITAQLARELFETNLIKLEVIGDQYTLQPDPFELVIAAKKLVNDGFEVLPYCTADIILGQKLIDCGCNVLMPWAAPIGSGKGIINTYALQLFRERFHNITLIVDAGIGRPSHATKAMELGYDGVLLNTAVALANNPVTMAKAFAYAIEAGHLGYQSGLMQPRNIAKASTPLVGKINITA